MLKAKLIYKDKVEEIEVSQEMVNVYNMLEESASKALAEADERMAELPPHLPAEDRILAAVFDETVTESDIQCEELDEIVQGFFVQKGVELFGFNPEDTKVEFPFVEFKLEIDGFAMVADYTQYETDG